LLGGIQTRALILDFDGIAGQLHLNIMGRMLDSVVDQVTQQHVNHCRVGVD